ncbi:CD63 antigen-like [Culicoides brevitarsis]|uniref:CD63 antigen-like n=1 Tax=Culicoides brevitarsis TaxID=469753 RepID=UPI00307B709D
MASALSWSASFVKYLLFGFNFVFAVTGIILLSVGLTVQGAYHGYKDILDSGFYSVPSLLIAIGSIIFFIAFFGCCGAIKENYCMTLTFSILLILVFILELSAGISGYVLRNQTSKLVSDGLKSTMKEYENSTEIAKIWDEIQMDYQCCGVNSPKDWIEVLHNDTNDGLPISCCKPETGIIGNRECNLKMTDKVYQNGCVVEFGNFVQAHAVSLGAAGIVLAFIQFIGIFFACFIAKQIRDRQWLAA